MWGSTVFNCLPFYWTEDGIFQRKPGIKPNRVFICYYNDAMHGPLLLFCSRFLSWPGHFCFPAATGTRLGLHIDLSPVARSSYLKTTPTQQKEEKTLKYTCIQYGAITPRNHSLSVQCCFGSFNHGNIDTLSDQNPDTCMVNCTSSGSGGSLVYWEVSLNVGEHSPCFADSVMQNVGRYHILSLLP